MKSKFLILLLFALCAQNAAATDNSDKKRKNGRMKKLFGLLLLSWVHSSPAAQTKSNPLCPATLPPYATEMMQYIQCGKEEQTNEFFNKYVLNDKEECSKLQKLYVKVQELRNCAFFKNSTDIVYGAKQRLFGKTPDRNTEVEMFHDYLVNSEEIGDHAEELSEKFEKLEKPDFFQIKIAAEFFKANFPSSSFDIVDGFMLAMHPEAQELNFDQVRRMMTLAKMFDEESPAARLVMADDTKYQDLDFDKLDSIGQALAERGMNHFFFLKELVKPENQNLNWDAVIRMFPYAKKAENDIWDQMQMTMDPKYQNLNFDQVDRMMTFTKNIEVSEPEQIKMALDPKYQSYDHVRIEEVLKVLNAFSPNDPNNAEKALEPWIQYSPARKDFQLDKIHEIFEKCKSTKNQQLCWNLKTKTFKQSKM